MNTEQQLDPLVCMALIHHQLETIHPFYDGNGRIGRIISILYLVFSTTGSFGYTDFVSQPLH